MARPVYSVRKGGISVAAWAQEGDRGGYTFRIEKRYKGQDGQWRDTQFLFENELLTAAELLREAWAALCPVVKREAAATGTGSYQRPPAGGDADGLPPVDETNPF